MCRVTFPGEAPAVWHGMFGGAIVSKGDKAEATTSDGKVHSL